MLPAAPKAEPDRDTVMTRMSPPPLLSTEGSLCGLVMTITISFIPYIYMCLYPEENLDSMDDCLLFHIHPPTFRQLGLLALEVTIIITLLS